jgi:hypothetical protein
MLSDLSVQRRKRVTPRRFNPLSALGEARANLLGPARQLRLVEAWKLSDCPTVCSFDSIPLHRRKMSPLKIYKV